MNIVQTVGTYTGYITIYTIIFNTYTVVMMTIKMYSNHKN